MSRNITIGIDIGTYAIRVVVSQFNPGDLWPKILGVGFSESKGLQHGYITNSAEVIQNLKKALNEAEKTSGVKIKEAIISLGGISLNSEISYGSAVISKADGEVTYLDVNKALNESEKNIKLINKKIIHVIPIQYKLDGKEILGRPESMKGIKLEVKTLFVTCLEQHFEDMITAVSGAGVEVTDVVAGPLAQSLIALNDKQKMAGCALIDIGAETVSITVFENGTVISLHVFSIGSTDITNDIALGLKISLEEAEKIKIDQLTNNHSKKKLEQIIQARLKDILELIDHYLKKIKKSGLLPAGIIMTGGGSNIKMIEDLARNVLNLPTKVLSPENFTNLKFKFKNSSWFTVLGLCIAGRNSPQNVSYNSAKRTFFAIKNFFKNISEQLLP